MITSIEKTFDSTCAVWRSVKEKQPNGSTKMVYKEIAKDIPCGVYVFRSEEFDGRRSVQPVTGDYQLYVDLSRDITKGDTVYVTSYGRTIKCVAGMPSRYQSHQEVICRHEDLADEDKSL